jgi:hypothetical protein
MAPAQKNVPLTFPTLTVGEIVYDLSQLGVNVSEVDLLRPSPGGVQVLWPQVIEALSGSPPQLDAVHKEGFSGSLPIILLRKYWCVVFLTLTLS